MTKEQIWLLLEIHNLLADTDKDNNHYGFNLLSEFIEKQCFATEETNTEDDELAYCEKCFTNTENMDYRKDYPICLECSGKGK